MTCHAKRKFGQNFLQDSFYIRAIIEAVHAQKDDNLIEIGPGLGSLTDHLVQKVSLLHVIEIDPDMIRFLKNKPYQSKLSIYPGDVLHFDFSTLGAEQKIVGNLAYNIATPLLFRLIKNKDNLIEAHFMLQKEVADKLYAQKNSHVGRLSLLMQYHFAIEYLFTVPPQAFYPEPKVESVFVRLTPIQPLYPVNNWEYFADLIKKAFAMKRKTLANNLKSIVSKEHLLSLGIGPRVRPEALSLKDYVVLSNSLYERNILL